MMTNSGAANMAYDETQFGYIRLQTAVNLLDYLAGLYVDELPGSDAVGDCSVRRHTIALEAALRSYVGRIAPDLLMPARKATRGRNYLCPRQPFTGGRPRKPPEGAPGTCLPEGGRAGRPGKAGGPPNQG